MECDEIHFNLLLLSERDVSEIRLSENNFSGAWAYELQRCSQGPPAQPDEKNNEKNEEEKLGIG